MKSIFDNGRIYIVQDEKTGEVNIDIHEVDGCYLGSTRTMKADDDKKTVLYRARHLNVTQNKRASDSVKPPMIRLVFFSSPEDEKALSMKQVITY